MSVMLHRLIDQKGSDFRRHGLLFVHIITFYQLDWILNFVHVPSTEKLRIVIFFVLLLNRHKESFFSAFVSQEIR